MVERGERQAFSDQPLSRYFAARLEALRRRYKDEGWLRSQRRQQMAFHYMDDPETRRRMGISAAGPRLALFDTEGRVYTTSWIKVAIPESYQMLGSYRSGRDYFKNPPKTKIPQRKTFPFWGKGVDVALRGVETVRDKYRLDKVVPKSEVWQAMAVVDRLSQLQQYLVDFSSVSREELDAIVQENMGFLEENRLLEPRSPEKQKIGELLRRGFVDSRGRKNYFAAITRIFGLEVALLKRMELAVPRTLAKYSACAELLRLKREHTREYLVRVNGRLGQILEEGIFAGPEVGRQPREVWIEDARRVWGRLRLVSQVLMDEVDVRPYVLGARKTVEHFGCIDFSEYFGGKLFGKQYGDLLGEERGQVDEIIAVKVQRHRREQGIPTVTDYLARGEFGEAGVLIEKCRAFLRKIVDIHADYMFVKPSLQRRRGMGVSGVSQEEFS